MAGKKSYILAAFLLAATIMTFSAAAAAPDFRPTLSWIADQRIKPGTTSITLNFTIGDLETAPDALTLSTTSSNTTLLPADSSGIVLGGSGANRTIQLIPATGQTGETTVTITVSDGTKTAATSFTLTVAASISGNTAPVIQGVPNGVIPYGMAYPKSGTFPLVVKDNESVESTLTLNKQTSNATLIPTGNIVFGGKNYGRTVKVTPATGQSGRAIITLSVSDGANTTSTSFVLDVLPATPANTPPTITPPANQIITLGASEPMANFIVGDAETSPADLQVWASSSNTSLLPNENILLSGSGATRTVTLNPKTGATGAATVNLTVCDGDLTTNGSFLLVVHDPSSPSEHFQRPRGIFALGDTKGGTSYTTTFGTKVNLYDLDISKQPFIDGFTLRFTWNDVESDTTPGAYDFHIIANAIDKLPAGQRLSITLNGGKVPSYILNPANNPGVTTWTSTVDGTVYPVPWDPYLCQRHDALLQAMAASIVDGAPLAQNPKMMVLKSFLPGGYTGIRDPQGTHFSSLPGYTRAKLLSTVQDELETLTGQFPRTFVQIGFWKFTDSENKTYGGLDAWEYVREQLLAEFDGVSHPHVGYFMENLAAARPGPAIDPYSFSPPTSYCAPEYLSQNSTWNGWEMLINWTQPFMDGGVDQTLNGTPSDAIEAAFNAYRCEYYEIYPDDINNPAMQPDLTLWHQFFDTGITTDSAVGTAHWGAFR